ncbi:hypothetical protein LQ327_17215 [Actinomycetospora endophytica]|uniref:Uncharacterized protein n=1 Tax=Actinomycetospora endophytica TaxID=2291215 RepID=A0ABS8PAG5_9PSEU|nr:hypothetical protein [Actinomycetospora endophytica]MCD2195109.1 hypothetical protein [Actinomycetospora endophytica]
MDTSAGAEPRDRVRAAERAPRFPDGPGERFAGWSVMGLPFRSGHCLALRHFASSIGPTFRSVWHRDPQDRWTMYADTEPRNACIRYFGGRLDREESAPIEIVWDGPRSFTVTVPGHLRWQVDLASTVATRLMTLAGGAMPARLWRSDPVLRVLASAAGALLGAGRLRLGGTAPNGQGFRASPRRLWVVPGSRAVVDGVDVGPVGPLPRQDRLGDFWLPQRGLLAIGGAVFETFDPARHSVATTRLAHARRRTP